MRVGWGFRCGCGGGSGVDVVGVQVWMWWGFRCGCGGGSGVGVVGVQVWVWWGFRCGCGGGSGVGVGICVEKVGVVRVWLVFSTHTACLDWLVAEAGHLVLELRLHWYISG